jgi:beta-D-xylosidase 4
MAINSTDTSGFAAAAAAAAAADATIVAVGLDLTLEREGHDRYSIGWPGAQGAFVADVCAAAAGPCIIALLGGGPVDISDALANPDVDAVFLLAYPGMGGGAALASALVGDAVPAGRTTKTFYPAEYVDQVSMFEFGMPAGPSVWPCCIGCEGACTLTPGRTHRFYTGTPVLPFGYGLSYTTFTYALAGPAAVSLDVTQSYLASNAHPKFGGSFAPLISPPVTTFNVTVKNTGAVSADDAVLAFILDAEEEKEARCSRHAAPLAEDSVAEPLRLRGGKGGGGE